MADVTATAAVTCRAPGQDIIRGPPYRLGRRAAPPYPRRRSNGSPRGSSPAGGHAGGGPSLVASGLISALVLALSGGAWALTGYVNGNVGRVDAGTAGTPPGGPLNILLAGVDRRSGLTRRRKRSCTSGTSSAPTPTR